MTNLNKYSNNDKATVCAGNNCVTVYGETARFVQLVVLVATVIALVMTVKKALR